MADACNFSKMVVDAASQQPAAQALANLTALQGLGLYT